MLSKKVQVTLLVVFYFVVSLTSFFLFTKASSSEKIDPIAPEQRESARNKLNSLPKTEACPLNGEKFSNVEKGIWEARRPLTVIIENHLDSRPQSGLSRADIVYEAVAEGGITRFLGIFYCGAAAEDVRVGPVRSARVYLAKWAYEYGLNPLFVHVGGANNICSNCPGGVKLPGTVTKEVDAFRLLVDWGWRFSQGNSMDGGTNVGYPVMWRDYDRIPGAATEHTYMGSTDKLFDEGLKRGFGAQDSKGNKWNKTFAPWKFTEGKVSSSQNAKTIEYEFWKNKPDYNVSWEFDSSSNTYKRSVGGKAHLDMDSESQLSVSNVVTQFVVEKGPVDKEYHMYYENLGTGKALIFRNGEVVEATWRRDKLTDRTKFSDPKGKEIEFTAGKVWISALPKDNVVNYN